MLVAGEPQRRNNQKIVSPAFDDGICVDVAHDGLFDDDHDDDKLGLDAGDSAGKNYFRLI